MKHKEACADIIGLLRRHELGLLETKYKVQDLHETYDKPHCLRKDLFDGVGQPTFVRHYDPVITPYTGYRTTFWCDACALLEQHKNKLPLKKNV